MPKSSKSKSNSINDETQLEFYMNIYVITNLNANTRRLTDRVFVQNLSLFKKPSDGFVKNLVSCTLPRHLILITTTKNR